MFRLPKARLRRIPLGPLAAALSVAAALSPVACPAPPRPPAPPPAPVALNGTTVRKLTASEVPTGSRVQARAGDYLVEGRGVRAIVAADSGALLDLVAASFAEDALDERTSVVLVGDQPALLTLSAIEAERSDGRAQLRVERVSIDGHLRVTDVFTPVASGGGLELITRVKNLGPADIDLRVGDRLRWFGRLPFAPHHGFVERARRAEVEWLARPGPQISYALGRETGKLDVDFRLSLRGPTEQLALGPWLRLRAGSGAEYRRSFLVAPGALERVARRAWALRKVRTGRVQGKLSAQSAWQRIEAYDPSGQLVAVVEPEADGRFEMQLPPGTYGVELRNPGGKDVQHLRVSPGVVTEARFIVPRPATVAFRVTDGQGALLPARLNFTGEPPTPDPVLGPPHFAAGAGNSSYAWTGEGSVALPSGRYRVTVSHGIEFSSDVQTVEVSAADGAVVRSTLKRAFELPGFVGCDFHVHAEPSGDSDVPLSDRVQSLLAEGVSFAVATDHNHVTDYGPAARSLGASDRLATAIGIELTTRDWGHFNAWPYPPGAALPPIMDAVPADMFRATRELSPGVVIQVNHPRMGPEIGYFDQAKLDTSTLVAQREGFTLDFDTLEVFNGFELPNPAAVDQNLRDWFALLEAGKLVVAVGNSDSHQLSAQWVGYPRTLVELDEQPGELPQRVASALRAGRATVSNGPVVELSVGGRGMGELASAKGGKVRARAVVHAASWVDVTALDFVANGEVLEHVDMAGPGAVERDLAVSRDSWVVAVARGQKPLPVLFGINARPLGFTNPVWIDADGDGVFRANKDAQ